MTKIHLTDFQAHSDTELSFDVGFNALLGPTNSGKSSVVRGVKWCLYDSIRGRRFIRKDAKEASVKIDFGNATVERIKGTSKNVYRANDLTLESVGVGVPPEVSKASGVPIIHIDKDLDLELNVSMQHDSLFLLTSSDGTKNKFLNVLTGNHVFDQAIKITKGKIKECEDAQKQAESTIETISKQLEAFKDLEVQENAIKYIEECLNRYEYLTQTINTLTDIQSTQIILQREILRTKESANKVDLVISVVSSQIDRLAVVEMSLVTLKEYSTVSLNLTHVNSKLANLDQAIQNISPKIERIEAIESTLILVRNASTLKLDLSSLYREIGLLDADIERVKTELLDRPDSVCSECGQIITKKAREALV